MITRIIALIEAAQQLCKSITEEQVHMISVSTMDEQAQENFIIKLLDLGQALQDYES